MDRRRRAARTVALMSLFTMTDMQENVPVASFDGDGSNLVSLIVGISPVQAGSGDPAPDNVRPISGWTECKVTRTGKNLNPWEGVNFSADTHPQGFWLNAGDYVFSLDTGGAFGNGNSIYIKLKDRSGNVITEGNLSGASWILNRTRQYYYGFGSSDSFTAPFTLLTDCFFCFGFNNTKPTANGVQLEVGSTATAYEPYQGQTYTIDLDGTRYGGTLDVTSGKLTVDRAMVDLGTLEWTYTTNWNGAPAFYSSALDGCADVFNANANTICSTFKSVSGDALWSGTTLTSIIALPTTKRFYARDNRFSTAADFKTAVTGQTASYPLATPIEVDLTPTEITTLLGTNNIWADTGEVKYIEYNI